MSVHRRGGYGRHHAAFADEATVIAASYRPWRVACGRSAIAGNLHAIALTTVTQWANETVRPDPYYLPRKAADAEVTEHSITLRTQRWIERHLRAQKSPVDQSIVEVQFAPDTSTQRHGLYQQATPLVYSAAANTKGALRAEMTAKTPAVIRLVPDS